MDGFKTDANFAVVDASGLAVGLPDNTMGNSEVGHLTIGAGAVDYQDLVRINMAMGDGSICKQQAFVDAFAKAKEGTGRLHLWGLLSDGGVHSSEEHLYAIIAAAKEAGVPRTLLHMCMDGRDRRRRRAPATWRSSRQKLAEIGHGEVSTISGRYYAMDRDKRWERVQKAYDVMCRAPGACEAVARRRREGGARGQVQGRRGQQGRVHRADGAARRRRDRRRRRLRVLQLPRRPRARRSFECMSVAPKFETAVARKPAVCSAMTRYNAAFESPIVFPPNQMMNGLGEIVSSAASRSSASPRPKSARRATRAPAEAAHPPRPAPSRPRSRSLRALDPQVRYVTFFFNGGREEPFEGEERELKESPKVATYDLEPKMAAEPVADAMVREIEAGKHTLLICNLAPPDMVGHTGMFDKAMEAAAHTDYCVGKVRDACAKAGVGLFILADHGNCETMLTPDGKPITSHSTSKVPFIAMVPADSGLKFTRADGGVADVAPTMLQYMGVDVPKEMTGKSFF